MLILREVMNEDIIPLNKSSPVLPTTTDIWLFQTDDFSLITIFG